MITRTSILCALPFLMVACTTTVTESDYSLQLKKDSVRLIVLGNDGKVLPAFDGKFIGVTGYLFTQNELSFHPGVRRLSRVCPLPPGAIEVLDVAPSVSFDFKAGHRYEFSCKEGSPSVREIE